MKIHQEDTAVVFADPQNEVLSEKGSAWPSVHESLKENNTTDQTVKAMEQGKPQATGSRAKSTAELVNT